MDKEKKQEFWVGLTVLLAMLVLVLGIVWGKGASILSNRRMYKARFETVLGLEGGDPVMIRGTRQGQVKKIRLNPRYVEVDFWIYENIPVYSAALCAVESEELMGGKQLSIEPGTGGIPVQDGHVFSGIMRGDAGHILGSLELVIDRTDSLLAGVQEIIGDPAWRRMIGHAEQSSRTLDGILTENRKDLREIVTRLDDLTGSLTEASLPERLEDMMGAVDKVSVDLDSTIRLIGMTVGRLEREEGTLGKMIRDRHLFDQLIRVSSEMDSLLKDIRSNPKKYVHFSLF